jgi:predicted nucleotidyltransferase component of viral defense system
VILSKSEILDAAGTSGFDPAMVEKVINLLNLLDMLNAHPFLRGKWVLKGGTALNLFILDTPRLSVDIDLNYIGALDRDGMLAERPKIEQAAQAVFSREGLTIRRAPTDHAGGKWVLGYRSFTGRPGNLEVDLNFMFRQSLWQTNLADSNKLGQYQATATPILDLHELAAGKLAALMARTQARDLFDCHRIFAKLKLNTDLLRVGFVAYGGMNRKDWRSISIEDVTFDPAELVTKLMPTLHGTAVPEGMSPDDYGRKLVAECKAELSKVLPLNENEIMFLDELLEKGRIDASLLTEDAKLRHRIESHPLLAWKALNVRRHKGIG